MKFEILDNDVSLTMNIFIIISIVLAFIYNSSQMIKLYYYKATRDFNRLYIFLQIISNCIWISYFIEINNTLFNPDNCYSKNTALSKDLQIIEVKSLNKSIKIGNLDYENLILAPEKEGVRIPIKITGKVKKPIKLQIKLANQEQPYLLEINNDYIF